MKFVVASLFLVILGVGVQSFGDDLSDIIFKKYAMLKVFDITEITFRRLCTLWLTFLNRFSKIVMAKTLSKECLKK